LEAVYYTIVAIILYVAADRILNRIEVAAGKRYKYRSLIFFGILMLLALTSFALIRLYTGNP
jgi:hypothetical protein